MIDLLPGIDQIAITGLSIRDRAMGIATSWTGAPVMMPALLPSELRSRLRLFHSHHAGLETRVIMTSAATIDRSP
jgi:hypothetical protein